ncbi:restriction endonuclease subunit S [Paraburkholderia sp. GAS38]|uniref:restriction endonuclease subunit S n=1 Tax=Paraburkholderia sp. GAS38 TaxID=3035133 RepID=UPI003D254E9A
MLDHYEVRSGLSKPAKDFGSGYPFLTFKDVFYNYFTPELLGDFVQSTQKERDSCSVLRGDVFLTRTSETMHELGMSCVALRDYKDATFNGFCKRLRPKPHSDLLPEYVGYYLRSPKFRQAMLALSTMSTRASLNNEMIGRLAISFPSRKTQARISEILKSLDDRITILRETNATLEAIAETLFKSWFVDFDPVRAKHEGRPSDSVDEAVAALFPNGFEASELGLVPRGWRVGTFGDLATLVKGSVNPLHAPNQAFEHYSLPAFDAHQLPVLEFGTSIKSNKTRMCSGVVLQSKLNPHIPRVWFPQSVGMSAVCSTEFLPWLAKAPASPEIVYCLLRSPAFEGGLRTLVTGTSNSHQRVKPDQVAKLRTVLATAEVNGAFTAVVEPLLQRAGENRLLCTQLTAVRDTLLPRLISGQIRLPEAEALVA